MDKRVFDNFISHIFVKVLLILSLVHWPGAQIASADTLFDSLSKTFSYDNGAGDRVDRRVYPEPPLPRLPRAGGKFIDPTFGTEIMRVTDERDGQSNGTYYSIWPTLNCDNTRLLVKKDQGAAAIYSFDPQNFRLGASRSVPSPPSGGALITEGAIWSATDPNILYGVAWKGPRLWALKVGTSSYTLIRDFSDEFDTGDYLWQMSMSDNADVFAFTRRDSSDRSVGYLVWRRSTNRILLNVASTAFNEVKIDKSGRFLSIPLNEVDKKGVAFYVRDLQTGTVTPLTDEGDHSPQHADVGTGSIIAFDRWDNKLQFRNLATPHERRSVLDLGDDWSMGMHISMLGRDESWCLVSFYSYRGRPPAGVFHDELVLLKTDGSQQVRRLLHHRSVSKDYWATPKANLSYDGKFAAFTSSWGNSGRNDLFIARIDTSSVPAPVQALQLSPTAGRLPSGWASQDIGSVSLKGNAGYSAATGTFTLDGSGDDIWGTVDAFRYTYRTLKGDGQIVARVASLTDTHQYAKAGVMIRESLTSNSRHVIMNVTPGLSAEFMNRLNTGGATTYIGGGKVSSPSWVKLARSGNSFAGYLSVDGVNWTLAGRTTVNMAEDVYIGLAVTSHSYALCSARFDSVRIR
jgi:hypothetical protein